eukprot:211583_1
MECLIHVLLLLLMSFLTITTSSRDERIYIREHNDDASYSQSQSNDHILDMTYKSASDSHPNHDESMASRYSQYSASQDSHSSYALSKKDTQHHKKKNKWPTPEPTNWPTPEPISKQWKKKKKKKKKWPTEKPSKWPTPKPTGPPTAE